jgi:hypothetical protein
MLEMNFIHTPQSCLVFCCEYSDSCQQLIVPISCYMISLIQLIKQWHTRFEVLMAVDVKITELWGVMLCSLLDRNYKF